MIKPLQQILRPAKNARRRHPPSGVVVRGASSREVVVVGGQARAGVCDALFVHMGSKFAATAGSAGFVAQHLHQEWVHGKPYIDPRTGIKAYGRAKDIRSPRRDILPPI